MMTSWAKLGRSGTPPAPAWQCARAFLLLLLFAVQPRMLMAQQPDGWGAGVTETKPGVTQPDPNGSGNTTAVPRSSPDKDTTGTPAPGRIKLIALLTDNGQQIDKGLVWRVFQNGAGGEAKAKLVATHRDASPLLKLDEGDYVVNVAFGRAHLTRKITVKPGVGGESAVEQFVLNAGGLRVSALVNGIEAAPGILTYEIHSDRDQSDRRKVIMTGAKPGLIIRLNAGIYHVVSTYGDANAKVQTDVTVEAGKLTEATLAHTAGRVTLKLVLREGGEAQSDTQWRIETPQGLVVKETAGALPSHFLAPGQYRAKAVSQGKTYAGDFSVSENQAAIVEVLMQ